MAGSEGLGGCTPLQFNSLFPLELTPPPHRSPQPSDCLALGVVKSVFLKWIVNQWPGLALFPSLPELVVVGPSPFLFVSPREALFFPQRPAGWGSHLAPCWGGVVVDTAHLCSQAAQFSCLLLGWSVCIWLRWEGLRSGAETTPRRGGSV